MLFVLAEWLDFILVGPDGSGLDRWGIASARHDSKDANMVGWSPATMTPSFTPKAKRVPYIQNTPLSPPGEVFARRTSIFGSRTPVRPAAEHATLRRKRYCADPRPTTITSARPCLTWPLHPDVVLLMAVRGGAGEKVGAFDVFDEVASGNSTAYIAADYYWVGKHPGFAYFTSVPFGMTMVEWNAWIKFNGGQQLWDKISGEFGLKALTCGGTGTQAGGWFNKEINSSDDLKGLKMRIPGLGGKVMSKLGASTVSLPGGQIYENLVSGAIDATEWVGPYNDYFLKFYEAAKYYYTGGMHEPGGGLAFSFNASFWGSLSNYEKAVLEAAAMEENAAQFEECVANNGKYLTKLVNDHGVQIRSFSDDTWDSF